MDKIYFIDESDFIGTVDEDIIQEWKYPEMFEDHLADLIEVERIVDAEDYLYNTVWYSEDEGWFSMDRDKLVDMIERNNYERDYYKDDDTYQMLERQFKIL